VYAGLQLFVAQIHKHCSTGATASPSPHALQRRDSEEYGRLVYSPENLTHLHHSTDWGAFDRGLDRPGESKQPGSFIVSYNYSTVTGVEQRSADTKSSGHVVGWNTEWKFWRAAPSHWFKISIYVS
jgi:hypothetical protein